MPPARFFMAFRNPAGGILFNISRPPEVFFEAKYIKQESAYKKMKLALSFEFLFGRENT